MKSSSKARYKKSNVRNDSNKYGIHHELLINHHQYKETITLKDARLMNYLREVIQPDVFVEVNKYMCNFAL